jgi:hypothetical protein
VSKFEPVAYRSLLHNSSALRTSDSHSTADKNTEKFKSLAYMTTVDQLKLFQQIFGLAFRSETQSTNF